MIEETIHLDENHTIEFINFIEINIGSIRANSISNIRKIIAIMKKWIEKDNRGDEKLENPHSNGEALFKSKYDFFEIKNEVIIRKDTRMNEIKILMIILIFSLS